ncbi:hypothetical protein PVAP13_1KG483000 [Panicum virgatum]|uniref:F-box/LRR-repeat protein 15/At3g58940/PEG3-like LRR domain-containing protein n=1 Tax=Panicum virgatum TaxID=38727 RepID=A0A8T0XMH2_PANVG|nr:hypothetical protein PVAP13_1KG483000 [Panicum virgatum]
MSFFVLASWVSGISSTASTSLLLRRRLANGLRAPLNSMKILAITVTFSSKENMESVMNLLKCFPFLETLHIQSRLNTLSRRPPSYTSSP